jgi:hypothetical protein
LQTAVRVKNKWGSLTEKKKKPMLTEKELVNRTLRNTRRKLI